jgi:hypothetical protein
MLLNKINKKQNMFFEQNEQINYAYHSQTRFYSKYNLYIFINYCTTYPN